MRVATFQVQGMTCSACSSTVERALRKTAGVHNASVSLVTCTARVEFEPNCISAGDLADTIDMVGFDAALEEDRELQSQVVDLETGKNISSGDKGKANGTSESVSVEMKVEGMTCSACSNTIERHLKSLPGVKRATVSLILARAYVVCDTSIADPQGFCGEIEDIGFDAELVAVSPVDKLAGRAWLHINLVATGPLAVSSSEVKCFQEKARNLTGVMGCQSTPDGLQRIVYDPYSVGARQLLQSLADIDSSILVEPAEASLQSEQLALHIREMESLRSDMRRALLPAAGVFAMSMLLPEHLEGSGIFSPLGWKVCHSIEVRALLILALATPVHFLVGRRFHHAAHLAIKRMSPNMDVLVSVATNTSYFYSVVLMLICVLFSHAGEAQMLVKAVTHFLTMGPVLIAVVCTGKFLEARSKLKAMEALHKLPSSQPASTLLCEHGKESVIPVEQVELGDVLRVHAGAKVAVDGVIQSETTVSMDESMLTGESEPVSKGPGDLVLAGTTCVSGGFLMSVTKIGTDTTLGQMVQLVQDAQASKAPVQRVADSVARVFVPSVISLALFTFLLWSALVFSGRVQVQDGLHHHSGEVQMAMKLLFAMKFGMAVLMIACPCAMGLATPMAVMVATGIAAQRGCMVKSAEALESSARLDVVILDKTGTITEGAPSLTSAACLAEPMKEWLDHWQKFCKTQQRSGGQEAKDEPSLQFIDGDQVLTDMDEASELQRCFWWLLGTVESASDHPIAKCISASVQAMPGLPQIVPPRSFDYASGRGVTCMVEQLGGVTARVGNVRFFEETAGKGGLGPLQGWVDEMQSSSHTVVLLHVDGKPVGAVAMKDRVRPDAPWVVNWLRRELGTEVWMCTGDNAATAQSIAHEVGITKVIAEALPSTKKNCVQQLQEKAKGGSSGRSVVCFVGDGMNDSPALAQANVGIAIGVGAQVAVEAADIALVRSELTDLVSFLALGQVTLRTIKLNFFWAFCFNFLCLPIAAGVLYPEIIIPPLAAGIGMAASSCLVVSSSLLIRCFQSPVKSTVPMFEDGEALESPDSSVAAFPSKWKLGFGSKDRALERVKLTTASFSVLGKPSDSWAGEEEP
mmetsp:Transcript_70492/g.168833  ORF Transcript_70492/g.168833 Transcript_70492/m.168833 type:complete len:1090 (+) Transcript_70492:104-3373(+)